MSLFTEISKLPDDPILSLILIFAADKNPKKVNLGIGAYRDDSGNPFILECVRKAEKTLLENGFNKEYLPIEGLSGYREEVSKLLLGPALHKAPHHFTAQTVGGTGALKIAGEFIFRKGIKEIYLPENTWPNHKLIFSNIGFRLPTYPYYDATKHRLTFSDMWKAFKKIPAKSIVLLHACCHNPTGMDPTKEQWQELSKLMHEHQLIPFFDIAYQGFGDGVDEDAYAIRHFVEQGHECLIANSFSKNFGLYGERVGSLTAIIKEKEAAHNIGSHFRQLIRSNYSNPPSYGARIVTTILQSKELLEIWIKELTMMRERIKAMRQALAEGLNAHQVPLDMSFFNDQRGIFSYTGLSENQVHTLREKYSIFLTKDGRANIAGLNNSNLEYVVDAFSAVMKS